MDLPHNLLLAYLLAYGLVSEAEKLTLQRIKFRIQLSFKFFQTTENSLMRFILFIGISFLSIAFVSCNGSKSLTKKAQKLETAGMVNEAASYYYQALKKKRSNVDAQIGMRTNGQLVLNEKLSDFTKKKNFGTKKEAVYSYQEALAYYDDISNLGVKLTLGEIYQQDYESVKSDYMSDLYDEGTTLLEAENYKLAEEKFKEISNLDPNFKDTESLKDIAYLEPLYASGVTFLEEGRYRSAHTNFEKVLARNSTYKEALVLKTEALETGRYTMAILPFDNATLNQGLDAKVSAYALEALTSINDPFLRIVDRQHLETILEEQQLGMSGIIDEETAVNVGELLGAHALVSGTILEFSSSLGKKRSQSKDGYEQYKVEKVNPETKVKYYETKYRKTQYKEYSSRNTALITFQYKVISLKTGEVLLTRIVDKEVSDEARYISYDGEKSKLYPAKSSGVNLNNSARKNLQAMFTAKQQPKSTTELSNELFDTVSTQMKSEISTLVKNTIK